MFRKNTMQFAILPTYRLQSDSTIMTISRGIRYFPTFVIIIINIKEVLKAFRFKNKNKNSGLKRKMYLS